MESQLVQIENCNNRNIAIIGGGMSGLITALRALKLGRQVTIFEKNDSLGGVFSKINNELGLNHYLLVGDENSPIRKVLNEVISFDFLEVEETEYLYSYSLEENSNLYLYRNVEMLKTHLISLAPFDQKSINELIDGIECAMNIDYTFLNPEKMNLFVDKNKKNYQKIFSKFGNSSIEKYSQALHTPILQKGLLNIMDARQSMALLILVIGFYCKGDLKFVRNNDVIINKLLNEFSSKKGIIQYNTEIVSIQKEDQQIKCKDIDDKEYVFDVVLDCTDLESLFKKRLPKRFYTFREKYVFENLNHIQTSSNLILIMKAKKEVELKENSWFSFNYQEKFRVGCKVNDHFKLMKKQNNIIVLFDQTEDDFEYWSILAKNKKVYTEELNRIIHDVSLMLEKFLSITGLICEQIITPYDFYKEYGLKNGGINGFILNPDCLGIEIKNTIKSFNNLIISSAWLMKPFWFYSCFIVSRNAINRIDQIK